MLYTYYFANMKKLPKDTICISICAKAPSWYEGKQYKRLAPKYTCLMRYKEDHDTEAYTETYGQEVLSTLEPTDVLSDIYSLLTDREKDQLESDDYLWWLNPKIHIVLLCFEKSGDFCHRHIDSEWLREAGIQCEEWSAPIYK